jgi:hypothetical protein
MVHRRRVGNLLGAGFRLGNEAADAHWYFQSKNCRRCEQTKLLHDWDLRF